MIARVFASLLAVVFVVSGAPIETPTNQWGEFFQFLLPHVRTDEFLLKTPKSAVFGRGVKTCVKTYNDYCQKELASDLGSTIDIFSNPIDFAKLVATYYQKTTIQDGLLKLCSAQIKFRSCLSVFYNPCTNPLSLYKTYNPYKLSLQDAFMLGGIYDDLEFDCGGGLGAGLKNWDCIQKVNNNPKYAGQMQTCVDDYLKHVNETGNFCSQGKQLSMCLTTVYRGLDKCVDNEVSWWVCERGVRRVNLEGYCEERCDDIFPKPPTKKPKTEGNAMNEFLEFVNHGGLFSEAKLQHFQAAAAKSNRIKH